jgi:transposase-like protein
MGENIRCFDLMEGFFGTGSVKRTVARKSPRDDFDLGRSGAERGISSAALRAQRRASGDCNGSRQRWISTGLGATVIELPRARQRGRAGKGMAECVIECYQRCTRSVDGALLGCYLSGANGRRIRGALSPLLRGAPLSKSAISRIVGRLQVLFAEWRQRSLKAESVVFLYLDAIALRVRLARDQGASAARCTS